MAYAGNMEYLGLLMLEISSFHAMDGRYCVTT